MRNVPQQRINLIKVGTTTHHKKTTKNIYMAYNCTLGFIKPRGLKKVLVTGLRERGSIKYFIRRICHSTYFLGLSVVASGLTVATSVVDPSDVVTGRIGADSVGGAVVVGMG